MKRSLPNYESESDSSSSTKPTTKSNGQRDLVRLPDVLIQREWRHTIETSLVNFIQRSPLKNISDNISPDFYGNMSPFLVREVMRMANPLCGVHVALHATLETMEDICREAVHRLLDFQASDLKTKQSITLLCESLPMPSVTSERQLKEDETLKNHMPLQVQHIIENDRHRNWLAQYKQAAATTINVFTVKLGPATEKATPETGRYVVSMLMPHVSPMYRLTAAHEPHTNSYEELDAQYTRILIELDSHKRMLKQCEAGGSLPLSKHSIHEEAVRLAGLLQDKRITELKRQCDQQRIQVGVLTNTVQEMIGVLHSEEQQNSMKDTVLVLIDKLKQSRQRNYGLIKCLQQKDADRSTMTFQKQSDKKRKILHESYSEDYTYTKSGECDYSYNSTTSGASSCTSSHRDEEEEDEDDDDSQ